MKYLLIRIGSSLNIHDHEVVGVFDNEEEAKKEENKIINETFMFGGIFGNIPKYYVVPYKELK